MAPGGGGRGLGGPVAKHWGPTGAPSSATRPPPGGEAMVEGEGNLGLGVKASYSQLIEAWMGCKLGLTRLKLG